MKTYTRPHAFTLIELITSIALIVCCLYFFSQKFIKTSGNTLKTSVKLCESLIESAKWHAINHQESVYFFIDISLNDKNFCKKIGFLTKNISTGELTIQQELLLQNDIIIIDSDYYSQIGIDCESIDNLSLERKQISTNDTSLYIKFLQIDHNGNCIDSLGNKKNSLIVFSSGKYFYKNGEMLLTKIKHSEGIRPIFILSNGKIVHTDISNISNLSSEL